MFDMSSFDTSIWFDNEEPYGASKLSLDDQGRPTTVWSAIEMARQDGDFMARAAGVFGIEADLITSEMLIEKAQETNSCDQLHSPITVYIDLENNLSVDIY